MVSVAVVFVFFLLTYHSHNRKLVAGDVLFFIPVESLKRENATSSTQGKKRARMEDSVVNPQLLPLDVLSEILSFIRVPQRLRYASLVCKQWRAAALRSVKSVSLSQNASINSALKLFPSLTALDYLGKASEEKEPIDLPARLLSLKCHNDCPAVRSVPPLQSLKIVTFEGKKSSSQLSAMLHASKTSLSRLDLRSHNDDGCDELGKHVFTEHFPKLTKLSIRSTFSARNSSKEFDLASRKFYERHAGQLQNLTVSSDYLPPSGIAFPLLQKLAVSGRFQLAPLVAVMSSSPNLVSVKTVEDEV